MMTFLHTPDSYFSMTMTIEWHYDDENQNGYNMIMFIETWLIDAGRARSSHVPPGEPAYAEFVIARRTMGASTATWTPVPVQLPHQKGDQ